MENRLKSLRRKEVRAEREREREIDYEEKKFLLWAAVWNYGSLFIIFLFFVFACCFPFQQVLISAVNASLYAKRFFEYVTKRCLGVMEIER